jgi:tetraacyldisaccharide 4'-kinase
MHDWLQRVWYGGARSGLVLLPLSWLFALVVATRRLLYRMGVLRTHRAGVPVVVVGNLTVGGTGKTPLTVWLAARLGERGVRPGIVLRGYGRTGTRPQLVQADSSAEAVGDEALVLMRRCRCPVAVGTDRVAAARLLKDVDVIIADDGLQHLRLGRDVEIGVVDGMRGFGNGRVLPAGPLRESRQRLHSVDAVVVNGSRTGEEHVVPNPNRFGMMLEPRAAVSLQDGRSRPLREFALRPVHAVAAIGNPARFFALLRSHDLEPIEHALPDHAPITRGNVDFGDGLDVLLTEKDAVKCAALPGLRLWYVPVDAAVNPDQGNALVELVLGRVRARGNR